MNKIKYESIFQTIKDNIINDIYLDKLPPVRLLAKEFDVSTHTMNKALKLLQKRGMIISSGPRGNLISKRNHLKNKTNNVGIFCNTKIPDFEFDPLLSQLKMAIEDDGYKPLFMNVPDLGAFNDDRFWSSNWVDGYIFVYSSITKKLAYELHLSGVPFVCANQLPSDYGIHWVDFNFNKTMHILVEALIAAGRRHIVFAIPDLGVQDYIIYAEKLFNKILGDSQCRSGTFMHISGTNVQKITKELTTRFMDLSPKADALICFSKFSPLIIENELLKKQIRMNQDYSLICRDVTCDKRFCTVSPLYKNLANVTWKLYKQVVENPEIEATNLLVDEYIDLSKLKTRRRQNEADINRRSLLISECL